MLIVCVRKKLIAIYISRNVWKYRIKMIKSSQNRQEYGANYIDCSEQYNISIPPGLKRSTCCLMPYCMASHPRIQYFSLWDLQISHNRHNSRNINESAIEMSSGRPHIIKDKLQNTQVILAEFLYRTVTNSNTVH